MTDIFDAVAAVRELSDWLDEHRVGSGEITNIRQLTGGTQNILVAFERAGQRYVLRRPPLHKRPNSDEAMRREASVLSSIRETNTPHPQLVAAEGDENRFGYAFFIMHEVSGFTATEHVPAEIVASPAAQQRMGFGAVDALLELQSIEADKISLPRRDEWLAKQTPFWRKLYDSHSQHAGWSADMLTGIDEVGSWLLEHQPDAERTGLIHGDFHFGNMMFSAQDGSLTSIIDWELASIGDPLLDLGHFLASYPVSRDPRTTGTAEFLEHLPTRDELIDHYIASTGRTRNDVEWFRVLACYRLAIIIEGTHARSLAGKASAETGKRLHDAAEYLMEQALELINQKRNTED